MTRASAHIVGAYEYPARRVEDATVAGIAQDVAIGAFEVAGLSLVSVDALFCDTTAGVEPVALAELLGLDRLRYLNSTDVGGSSYLYHVGQAVQALESGVCDVALVVMAGLATRKPPAFDPGRVPGAAYEPSGVSQPSAYALVAQRHMYEYGTTSEQLAAVRVAASTHAQYNPLARFRDPVTVDDVLSSPMISDPLHRLDCCLTTDWGGALVLVSSWMAGSSERAGVGVRGYGFALAHNEAGFRDITISAAVGSGRDAFAMAGVKPADIGYASIYD